MKNRFCSIFSKFAALALFLSLFLFLVFKSEAQEADLVLINGHIITLNDMGSIAEAVAVSEGLIVYVGANADINTFIGPNTQVIDLEGKTLTPGLIDSHNHLMYYGQSENDFLNLRPPGVTSIADLLSVIENYIDGLNPGDWVIGDGFFKLSDDRLPTKYDLDQISPDHPVMITSIGGHYGVANSMALEIAGIRDTTENPVGGIIARDPGTGEANGILWNHPAMDLVRMHYPPFDQEALVHDVLFDQEFFISYGLTSIQDVNTRGLSRLQAYIAAEEDLKLRAYLLFTIEKTRDAMISLELTELFSRPWLSYRGDKFLLDGQPPTSYTYDPHPGPTYQLPTWEIDTLKKVVKDLHQAGHQLAFHVMGDRAIDLALDAIEEALLAFPNPDHRHRLEHCMIPTPEALLRIRDLGVVLSMQPGSIYESGDLYELIWGSQRMQRFKPMRTILNLGIPLALGSDFPTVPELSPQLGLWAAVTRQTESGAITAPQQSITIEEALYGYTMGSAYAAFEDEVKGSIEPGKYADMAVWSDNLYAVETEDIKDLEILMVIIDGNVYSDFATGVNEVFYHKADDPFVIFRNYPNPFSHSVRIEYHIKAQSEQGDIPILLEIYDMAGNRIKKMVDRRQMPGLYSVEWDGNDEQGNPLPSAMYLYHLRSGDIIHSGYLVLQRG